MRLPVAAATLVALFLTACGGAAAPEAEAEVETAAPDSNVDAAAIPHCYSPGMTDSFEVVYYTNASKTREAGRDTCNCGSASRRGSQTTWYSVIKWKGCIDIEA